MSNELPDSIIEAITANVAEAHPEVTAEIVTAVINQVAAAHAIVGDPIDTIRRSETGDLATRVERDGIPMWRIQPASSQESLYYDMAPTLPWSLLFSPEA